MIQQVPSVVHLLPNIYSLGHRIGVTLVKYYVLMLVATKDMSLQSSTNPSTTTTSDDSIGSCISATTDRTNDTVCTSSHHDTMMDGTNTTDSTPQQMLLLQQLPKQLYSMIIAFPVWYSEWWWNLVQNDPIHVLVETILLLSIFYFLVSRRGKSYKEQQRTIDRLSKQEEDELIAQWIRHERQPLTPYSNAPNGSPNVQSHSSNGTTAVVVPEYRPTLVVHKSSGRFMQVEEVLHSSTINNNNNNSTGGRHTGTTTGTELAPSTIPTNAEGHVTSTILSTTNVTPPGTSVVHTKTDMSLPQQLPTLLPTTSAVIIDTAVSTTLPTSTTTNTTSTSQGNIAATTNIIQVLNFATMDFLGMSADHIPTSMDDDDDDEEDENHGTAALVITSTTGHNQNNSHTNHKHSKRNANTMASVTTPPKPTTKKSVKDRPLHPVKVASLEALDRYGCGSCGPRGFYGTIDVHLHIEKDISTFLHTEDAILYSDGASTVTSTVAAFCKRGDIIVVDEAVYEPIRTGVQLSRANIKWFAHNDMNDLRRVLLSIQQSDKKRGRKSNAQRRFIVVEGLYKNTGSICPLDELIALKHEFSCRLILDESFSFGTLGPTGRGVTEMYQQKIMHDVEITCVSLENAMGSIGGLTTGTEEIVDHQRLSGSGYCYSASSPPFTASAAVAALNLLQTRPDVTLQRLNRNCLYFHQQLQILLHDKLEDLLIVTSDARSPIIFLQVADIPETEYLDEVVFLQEVVRESFIRGVAFVATATGTSAVVPAAATGTVSGSPEAGTNAGGFIIDLPSSVRMTVSAVHTLADIDCAIQVLGESVDVVMSRFYDEETTM